MSRRRESWRRVEDGIMFHKVKEMKILPFLEHADRSVK